MSQITFKPEQYMEGGNDLTISREYCIEWFKIKAAFHVPNKDSSCSSKQIEPFAFLNMKTYKLFKATH